MVSCTVWRQLHADARRAGDAPEWPHGMPQQLHLDLYVADLATAHEEVLALGGRVLRPAADPDAVEGFQVYADPAGHPFCLCWR